MKSGRLNLLEPSGPQRACYGTPLPFTGLLYLLPYEEMGVNTCAKLQYATYSTAATAQVMSMCKLACQLIQLFRES